MPWLTKEEIIERYIKLTNELGIIPGCKEIALCDYMCSKATIKEKFGGLGELREACRIFHPAELSGKPPKFIIEKTLMRLRVERGRRLDYLDILNCKELPNSNYIKKIYDNKSLTKIWDEIENKMPDSLYYWKK